MSKSPLPAHLPDDLSELHVVIYPDPVLRQRAKPVPAVTAQVRALAERMTALMHEEEGIGLAAPQVGVPWRLFVAHVPESRPEEEREGAASRSATAQPPSATSGPVVYINPELSAPAGAIEPFEEGCLSLPDIRATINRPPTITITATDLEGRRFTQTGTGLLARCWQHEVDHLDGVLILDRMGQMDRLKLRKKVRALEEE